MLRFFNRLFLFSLLGTFTVFAAEVITPLAEVVLARYLSLPFPQEDLFGEARIVRLRTLDELKPSPLPAVRAIARVLPGLTDPRQRKELTEALGTFPIKEAAVKLTELLDDPDAQVRSQVIVSLRLMARRVDRMGSQRVQRGAEFAPQVEGLVPQLVKAAGDKDAGNRSLALHALADTLDPVAIAEIRRRLKDENTGVRFHAACLLTEFQDASGLGELKRMLAQLRSETVQKVSYYFYTEELVASLERITGKRLGPIPLNPVLSSDGRSTSELEQQYKQLIDAWAAWWAWEPQAK